MKTFLYRKFRFFGVVLFLSGIFIFFLSSVSHSQDASALTQPSPLEKQQSRLIQISERKIILEKELAKISKEKPGQEELKRSEEIYSELETLNRKFDSSATQVKEKDLKVEDDQSNFSWMEELQEITRPLLAALREITERPRKIENLKTRIHSLKQRIASFEKARNNLEKLKGLEFVRPPENGNNIKPGINTDELKKAFESRLELLEKKYDPQFLILDLEEAQKNLNRMLSSDKSFFQFGTKFIKNFLQVRGRNLLIAVSTFLLFWAGLAVLFWVIDTKTILLSRLGPHYRKIVKVFYNIFSLGVGITASVISLYLLDDWLILSVIILLFIGLAIGFRHFFPKFIDELRLIMNLGNVREGERLLWKGIPWKVQEIGMYTILRNPRLQGGILRLLVGELSGHHSRPLVHEEEWFPTKVDDWVILSDGTFGRVLKQTSEQVVIENLASRKYYQTAKFLEMEPRNLSTGYRIVIQFGLDYGVQQRITGELPRLFQGRLREIFKNRLEGEDPDINSLHVHFDSAQASSLNLIVLFKMNGRCAEEYYPLKWEINRMLVQICNENKLVIPFTQLTISPSPEVKNLVKAASGDDQKNQSSSSE